MNTRQFLKTLLTIGVSPSVLIPKYNDHYQWIKTDGGIWMFPWYDFSEFDLMCVEVDAGIKPDMILYRRGKLGKEVPERFVTGFKNIHTLLRYTIHHIEA